MGTKEALEYALDQSKLGYGKEEFLNGAYHQFNNVLEEVSKLGLLPAGAYDRLYIKEEK